MTEAREDEQRGMFDEVIENEELEAAIDTIAAFNMQLAIFREKYQTKDVAQARKLLKETVEAYAREHELIGGERLRVGKYIVNTAQRAGGGFEVPVWQKVLARNFELFQPGQV